MVKIVNSPAEMKNLSLTLQRGGRTAALVPTMGALHEGHLSLLKIAADQADFTVMSVFVNPSQFGANEDFSRYPRTLEHDSEKARSAGCDILFVPSVAQMYPEQYSTYVSLEKMEHLLCGKTRPQHFRGVATVVLKFFNIVSPQIAVFGQKDAQQFIILKKMVQDLNISISMIAAPIIREADGLAMSSRNRFLLETERKEAPLIYKGLSEAQRLFSEGVRSASQLRSAIEQIYVKARMFVPEYIEVVDSTTLVTLEEIDRKALVAVACRTAGSNTRLIDNLIVGGEL